MTENPLQGQQATPPVSEPQPTNADGTTVPTPDNGGTGNPADAGVTDSNPTDSSSVSDDEGVQSLAQQEQAQQDKRDEVAEAQAEHQERVDVDHEGTGPGDEAAPESDYEGQPDGSDNA